jgi:hypothetical protein
VQSAEMGFQVSQSLSKNVLKLKSILGLSGGEETSVTCFAEELPLSCCAILAVPAQEFPCWLILSPGPQPQQCSISVP